MHIICYFHISYRFCEINGLGVLAKPPRRGRGRVEAAALAGRGRVVVVALAGRGRRFNATFEVLATCSWRLIGVPCPTRLNFFRAGEGALAPSRILEGVRKFGLPSVNEVIARK